MTPVLALERVSCTFLSRDDPSERYTAVSDTTLVIGEGEFVSVVGPTGCGKTTLLNVAAGLLKPSTGTVTVLGRALGGINTRAGYMFQTEALMPWRNTMENVVAGLEFRGVARKEALERGDGWLARVGLSGFDKRYPHQLSGGMRKRVALAQMLILYPQILLMDEHLRERDALAHSTGELVGVALVESAEANAREPAVTPFKSLFPSHTAKFQAGDDIFHSVAPRHERLGLEHVARARVDPAERASEHGYRAGRGLEQPGSDIEQSRLAAARGAHHRNEFTLTDDERGIADGGIALRRIVSRQEGAADALERKDGSHPLFVLRVRFLHELVRVGELEFDFLCLHLGIEGRYDFERVSRAGIRDDSVRRDGFLHLVEREQVQRLVGEQIRLGNRAEHVLGRSGLDPPVGADDGVGERLDRARVLSNEIDRCIEATRGHRTAQDLLGSPQGAGVGDDPDVPILLEFGHDRIGVGNGVDLAALQSADGRRSEADADDGDIGRLEAACGNEVIEDHVRARARRGNADLQAFQVFRRLVVLRSGRGDSDCDLRRPALLHEALEVLALGLHVERVLVGSRYDIGASAHDRPQRLRAPGKVADRQAQTFVLEVAELLGDGERQVVQRGFSPDGDMHVLLLERALRAGEHGPARDQDGKREVL